MRTERRQDMGRTVERGAGGRENPNGVREDVIKKRPADLGIIKEAWQVLLIAKITEIVGTTNIRILQMRNYVLRICYYFRIVFKINSFNCCSVGSCNWYLETNICSSNPVVVYRTNASFLSVTSKMPIGGLSPGSITSAL